MGVKMHFNRRNLNGFWQLCHLSFQRQGELFHVWPKHELNFLVNHCKRYILAYLYQLYSNVSSLDTLLLS